MILCIFWAANSRPRRGVQRGLPLALLGNFQRYGVLRLGKFPNKLRYFLRKYPAACRRSARVLSARRLNPLCVLGCLHSLCWLYLLYRTPRNAAAVPISAPLELPYYFSLSVGGGLRGGRFRFQRLLCTGRSDASFRGRILPEA